jgi:hypothetical protein
LEKHYSDRRPEEVLHRPFELAGETGKVRSSTIARFAVLFRPPNFPIATNRELKVDLFLPRSRRTGRTGLFIYLAPALAPKGLSRLSHSRASGMFSNNSTSKPNLRAMVTASLLNVGACPMTARRGFGDNLLA